MTDEENTFQNIGQSIDRSDQGKLFGKSCFKINGKAFTCFFQNEMVFKLDGEFHHEAISLEGTQLFDPSGKKRPMKEWVQVPSTYIHKWPNYAEAAMNYVKRK